MATDEEFFQGRLDSIAALRSAVPLPVLRYDFIIDPYQVYETRAAGADAIVLMANCLDISQLFDLQILAARLNLTCLIEVHDIQNLMRVRDHVIGFPHRKYSLLVISNRNPQTWASDLGTTLRLAELVEDRRVLVSAGGISSAADVGKLAAAGVKAAMVGQTLLRSSNIAQRVRDMFGP